MTNNIMVLLLDKKMLFFFSHKTHLQHVVILIFPCEMVIMMLMSHTIFSSSLLLKITFSPFLTLSCSLFCPWVWTNLQTGLFCFKDQIEFMKPNAHITFDAFRTELVHIIMILFWWLRWAYTIQNCSVNSTCWHILFIIISFICQTLLLTMPNAHCFNWFSCLELSIFVDFTSIISMMVKLCAWP